MVKNNNNNNKSNFRIIKIQTGWFQFNLILANKKIKIREGIYLPKKIKTCYDFQVCQNW